MKAAVYRQFRGPLTIENVADPAPPSRGVVIRVEASGLCRSDWHGWMGHDPDIGLPHVPGHELAGFVESVGGEVKSWKPGDRVTVPFVGGCGECPQCACGQQQVCDRQFQPGFTHWGSFAEYVSIDYADVNLVRLPDELDFVVAASLGCRFVTSFRAIVDQGRIEPEQWVAIHGCGGVGLSAVMIARAKQARVVAIDIDDAKLALAKRIGADEVVNASGARSVAEQVIELTGGGAHLAIDALGSATTCCNSIASLRKRGKHVQVGLMVGADAQCALPMDRVVAEELEIVGSHGIQAHRYAEIFALIRAGALKPEELVGRTIGLDELPAAMEALGEFEGTGITVVDRF